MHDGPIVIGVDPHKASWTAAVIDSQQRLLGQTRAATTVTGYDQLREFARNWPRAQWALEGAGGLGRPLARRLLADGATVVDVPAKLSARVRTLDRGHGRKTDRVDAVAVAVAALRGGEHLRLASSDDPTLGLRLLSDRRDDLVAQRSLTVNRLHAHLLHLVPGGAPLSMTAVAAAALLRTCRPTQPSDKTRKRVCTDLLADLRRIDAQIKVLDKDISAAVKASGSHLTELYGLGPVLAARILGRVGDVQRFSDEAHFASYCGVAPIEVSSGDTMRHRLSRAGDRLLNHALHIMAITQVRGHPAGRDYYRRKRAAGKSHNEALRCLKRRLCNAIYRQLVRDTHRATTAPGGQLGATTSSAAGPTPTTDSSGKPLPETAKSKPRTSGLAPP